MLTKILFTLAVIIVVALYYRTKQAPKARSTKTREDDNVSLSVRTVTYMLIGVLILLSATVFFFKYRSDNKIVNIRVVAEDGNSTLYQARQKTIKGRQFVTLDEKKVTLGESDRFEIDDQ